MPDTGESGAEASAGAPPWVIMPAAGGGLLDGPARPDVVTISEEPDGGRDTWLTRPRAAIVSAGAILVIVAGIVLAGKIAAAPAPHRPDSRPSPAVASTPSPAASGTAPSAAASRQHPRKHSASLGVTSTPPFILPSTNPLTSPPSAHSSAPSKPKPSPTKSKKPSSPPASPSPPTSSLPDPSPTTSTGTASP
jgi:hypothetical protein